MYAMRRLRKFLQVPWSEKLIFLQALFALAVVTVGLRIFPWLRLQAFLLKRANRHSHSKTSPRSSVSTIGWAVHAAGRWIPNASCLPQALVGEYFLIRNDYSAQLQIGVARRKTGTLEAHAWVTSDGKVIVGNLRDLDGFVPLSPNREDYGKAF